MKHDIKTSKFDWIKKEKRKNFLIVPLDQLINIVFVKSKFIIILIFSRIFTNDFLKVSAAIDNLGRYANQKRVSRVVT